MLQFQWFDQNENVFSFHQTTTTTKIPIKFYNEKKIADFIVDTLLPTNELSHTKRHTVLIQLNFCHLEYFGFDNISYDI